MRITHLEARAFGAIAGRTLDLPDGLVVLHGPNESGKSSTVDLIRGVLFGFQPLRRDRGLALREPRGGGDREGRVDVVAADGRRLTVERRHGARILISDDAGEPVGEPALRSALGGADESLFLRVQTFSADDLAPLGLLDEPGVREQVLAAAVMGGGPGAGDLLRALDERSRALYLRGGENQRFAERSRRLKEARVRLRDAEGEAGRVAGLAAETAAAEERLAASEATLADELVALERVERLRTAGAVQRDLRDLDAAPIADLVEPPDPAAVERLRRAVAALPAVADARARVASAQREAEAARAEVERVRARIGLAGPVPALADEGVLRSAARTARAADEATERARRDHVEVRAALPEAQPESPAPAASATARRPPLAGIAAVVVGVVLIAIGVGLDQQLVWGAGLAVLGVGAFLIGRGRGGTVAAAPAPPAEDPRVATQADLERRAEALARCEREGAVAQASWVQALSAVGVEQAAAADQLDELLAAFAAVRAAEADAARAVALRQEEEARIAGALDAVRAALAGSGAAVPDDGDALEAAAGVALAEAESASERAARAAEEARIADERRRGLEVALAAAVGDDADLAREAAAADPAALEAQRDILEARVAQLRDEEIPAAHVAIGEARAAARHLEQSADVATAALDVAEAEAELREVADEWLTVELARRVVHDAHARFVEERQPAVMARAAERVREATGGAWRDLRMLDGDDGGARSVIIAADGHRMPFSELSQGAVGLVYLCLRIGLVEELAATTGVALPVIMDDVLTHLDPEREAGAARVIADLANRHQVIYLTCHASQVAALRQARPDLHEIRLDRLV